MVQARFSWGLVKNVSFRYREPTGYRPPNTIARYYGAILPSLLNVFSMQGFLILNCIIGGQTLASVSDRINGTAGIIIIGLISLVVGYFEPHFFPTFLTCGYRLRSSGIKSYTGQQVL